MPTLRATSRSGEEVDLNEDRVEALRSRLRGPLIEQQHPDYDDARRVYNAMHDRRPALVVRAAGVADVMATVSFAHEHNLLLAVRGGGHSVPGFGTCDGGVVVDLGRMKGVRVDPKQRTARAEGGCTWGDFNHAAHAFGLATPGGIVSTTGIGGLTLGGGIGYLSRQFGFSCDNVISADVVTADGEFMTCDAEHEPDLFWAIRGGGGNFGVVTSFEYKVHPVGEIFGGPTFYRADGEALGNVRKLAAEAPDELGLVFAIALAPPLPFVPEEWHLKPVIAVIACWTGSPDQDEEIAATLNDLGSPVGQALWRMPYPVINTLFDDLLPPGLHNYWKANFARELSAEAIAVHLQHGPKVPTVESGTFLMPINGACHRIKPDDAAFAHRDSDWAVVVAGAWPNAADNEANTAWVRGYYEALRPHSEEGGYVNFMSDDDQDRVASNYGPNYARLSQIKKARDPGNLFRINQNISLSG